MAIIHDRRGDRTGVLFVLIVLTVLTVVGVIVLMSISDFASTEAGPSDAAPAAASEPIMQGAGEGLKYGADTKVFSGTGFVSTEKTGEEQKEKVEDKEEYKPTPEQIAILQASIEYFKKNPFEASACELTFKKTGTGSEETRMIIYHGVDFGKYTIENFHEECAKKIFQLNALTVPAMLA